MIEVMNGEDGPSLDVRTLLDAEGYVMGFLVPRSDALAGWEGFVLE